MAACKQCGGTGQKPSVENRPEYGRIRCDECDGCGSVCSECGATLKSNRFFVAGPDICVDCGDDAVESKLEAALSWCEAA